MSKIVKARLVATVQIDVVVDEELMEQSPNFKKRGDAYEVVSDQIKQGALFNALKDTLKREFESDNGEGFYMSTRADQMYADAWIVQKGEAQ